jgi:2-C-methyl-D-erythritol 4-phosphate cytidylyltransferase
MVSATPKQYMPFKEGTVIDFTLQRLLSCEKIKKIVVAIQADDTYWNMTRFHDHPKILTASGGSERSSSVLNALQEIEVLGGDNDWVLVHDAARPCVLAGDIHRLIDAACTQDSGALLVAPIADTVKQVSGGVVSNTLDRSKLRHALTPQIFRVNELKQAIVNAAKQGQTITDEASAIELIGGSPVVVEGRSDNIKITTPSDLSLARFIVEQQELELCE